MQVPKLAWLAAGAAALLLTLWLGAENQAPAQPAAAQPPTAGQPMGSASPEAPTAPERPRGPTPAAASVSANANSGASERPKPALDRALPAPYPRFEREDRTWQVLGTRQVDNRTFKQEVLVLQEEKSGQLEFRQPMLSFSLQPGHDYEAFISERPRLRRRFVNPLYAEVEVDAAHIAEQYSALAQDSRVSRVGFVALRVPALPR